MLISRDKEKKTLLDALQAEDSQFIAVYGRRRVGKTYLIRQTYSEMLTFEHSGLAKPEEKSRYKHLLHRLKELVLKSPSCRQIGLMPLNY
jgi:AAA+ ATPase superfamily predicted ATPase